MLKEFKEILCIKHYTFSGTCDILCVFDGVFLFKMQVCYSCNRQKIHDNKPYYVNQTSYCSLTRCIEIVYQRFMKMCFHFIDILSCDKQKYNNSEEIKKCRSAKRNDYLA